MIQPFLLSEEQMMRISPFFRNRPVSLPCRTESGSDSVRFG